MVAMMRDRGREPSTAGGVALVALAATAAFPAYAPVLDWIVAGGAILAIVLPEKRKGLFDER